MKVQTIVHRDEKLGPAADITEITHQIESVEDFKEIIKVLLLRQQEGWGQFTVQTSFNTTTFNKQLAVSFRKGDKWEYMKMELVK